MSPIFAQPEEAYEAEQRRIFEEQAELEPPTQNVREFLALDDAWEFRWRHRWYRITHQWMPFNKAMEIFVLDQHFRFLHRQLRKDQAVVKAGDEKYAPQYILQPEVQNRLVEYTVSGQTLQKLFHQCCRPRYRVRRVRWRWRNPFMDAAGHEIIHLSRFFLRARMEWTGLLRLGLKASAPLRWTSSPTLPPLSLSTKGWDGLRRTEIPEVIATSATA